tara:strand:+ start:2908 stop:4257 length:1350 start_codon:yes stop_codon:yes gene_type:complete
LRVTYHNSAAVSIDDDETKILIDPWLTDGEYFGSWGIYPPYNFKPEEFNDVDYIYISHIHPDHCSTKTLSKLNKKIPVIIHSFPEKYFKKNIERLGFNVIEIENNTKMKIANDFSINILAADNCNPEVCGKLFGCSVLEPGYGTANIDTLAIFENKKEVIINTNDCPYEISEKTAKIISKQYENVDFLLVGYAGASSYPQCFNFSEVKTKEEAEKKKIKRLNDAINYVKIFNPKFFMPFAGKYTLAGKNYFLNEQRGEPDLDFAVEYLTNNIDQMKNKCVVLNSKESFDITTETCSKEYKKNNQKEKNDYIKNVLSKIKYSFELEPIPKDSSIEELLPMCYDRFNDLRKHISYETDTKIILKLNDNKSAIISCNGEGYEIQNNEQTKKIKKFIAMDLDNRLLYWLLQGPQKAHWNNAEIGSHIQFIRTPDIYERGLIHCWNYFYSGKYD